MKNNIKNLSQLIRAYCLMATTAAGSGHPTSCLSAADLMTVLMFDGTFRADLKNPKNPNNDRLIFSKGHAAPLLYALYTAAGVMTKEELLTLRQFNSRLEGHPTMAFPFTEAATGSLGQGLSIGIGMAINAKYIDTLPYRTYVLLGDSEMAEGSVWEAMNLAAYYKLNNLIAIVDVNRLGQRGQTMFGHNVDEYKKRAAAFGWEPIVIDGHNLKQIAAAYAKALRVKKKPVMIIAKTIKGKGVKMWENKEGFHAKVLMQEQLKQILKKLGPFDATIRSPLKNPVEKKSAKYQPSSYSLPPRPAGTYATKKAYGDALIKIHQKFPQMVVLDAETCNSTFSETFKKAYPKRFFEMFIAEQNMVGVALGLSAREKIPFVSTFGAFLTRAHDQIRMSQYSNGNIKFVGSYAGVSLGPDGSSQMALEDIAMMRSVLNCVVLYPCDAVSTEKLVAQAAAHIGNVYLRTTREETPVMYPDAEEFPIGGSKVLKSSDKDVATVVAAGITVHEALAAYDMLQKEKISIRVIDLYSIKPLDEQTLKTAAHETGVIITVEDHYPEGGIGEAVATALTDQVVAVHIMAVRKMPHSGKPAELLEYEEISRDAIVKKVKGLV